ncbi:MAG: hypothetical protein ABSG99_02685 [Sedimentisphaerales bacterium]
MKEETKKIRQAVLANRGGLEEATDEQIMVIWQDLPADVQKQYISSLSIVHSSSTNKEKEKNNAVST